MDPVQKFIEGNYKLVLGCTSCSKLPIKSISNTFSPYGETFILSIFFVALFSYTFYLFRKLWENFENNDRTQMLLRSWDAGLNGPDTCDTVICENSTCQNLHAACLHVQSKQKAPRLATFLSRAVLQICSYHLAPSALRCATKNSLAKKLPQSWNQHEECLSCDLCRL